MVNDYDVEGSVATEAGYVLLLGKTAFWKFVGDYNLAVFNLENRNVTFYNGAMISTTNKGE